jgi:endoglucanase
MRNLRLSTFSSAMAVAIFMMLLFTNDSNAQQNSRVTRVVPRKAVTAKKPAASPEIRINQLGFYPSGPKVAVVLTGSPQKFNIQTTSGKVVYAGTLKPAAKPDLSGKTIFIADFTNVQQPGDYLISVPAAGLSYPFRIRKDVHEELAAGSIKAFYLIRNSTALPEKYAGKWKRATGHPDTAVLIHSSAATADRPEGSTISSPRGWYDAGDYNKYIVNSGITTGTLLSLYEDFPQHMKAVNLAIPESTNRIPDLLDESLWNLRWMLTMQDPADGGVYHKLTNAKFDGMVMPDKAVAPRYVVQKGTAATLNFAAVTAQASRILKAYEAELPGLADSCLKASLKAWDWAQANPALVYNQDEMNKKFKPEITTGAYGDRRFDDELAWAAAELYITTQDDKFLKSIPLDHVRLSLPSWANVANLGYYSLLRNRERLTPAGKSAVAGLKEKMIAFADSLANPETQSAYQTAMGRSPRDYNWGSSSNAANQGIALVQAYLLTNDKKYIDAALGNLDYLLGRNGTSYSFVTGFGQKLVMHPHHRTSIADGVEDPVPGLLSGGPNPGQQDKVPVPSPVPNQAFADHQDSYATNEIAINWNAPFAYLANAIEALRAQVGYVKE